LRRTLGILPFIEQVELKNKIFISNGEITDEYVISPYAKDNTALIFCLTFAFNFTNEPD